MSYSYNFYYADRRRETGKEIKFVYLAEIIGDDKYFLIERLEMLRSAALGEYTFEYIDFEIIKNIYEEYYKNAPACYLNNAESLKRIINNHNENYEYFFKMD